MHCSRLAFAIPIALTAASFAAAQQPIAIPPDMPIDVGPGTQGTLVYEGPPVADVAWYCGATGASVGEIADDLHMVQGGSLASFDFTYGTFRLSGDFGSGNDAVAVVSFYGNDPGDSVMPDAGSLIASYTITGLPWFSNAAFKRTFDVPGPVYPSVPADVWMGVEIFVPQEGTVGSLVAAGLFFADPTPVLGTSHFVTWHIGPTCFDEPYRDTFTEVNYLVNVRVFPQANEPPTCTADLAAARASFLEPSPGAFVVTEGETITVDFDGDDPDADLLTVSATGMPPGASLSPWPGPRR